ncbi:hypothetical protein ACA086_11490 [Muriicola sp. E247]|uniref:hypothetical protein n=1 Tax=Muriicola sp. E247 TaxID=3242730 RepID=UPI003523A9F9
MPDNERSHSNYYILGQLKSPGQYTLLIPFLGMACFVILYLIAAIVYPGGSAMNPQQIGFSFWNNYLCDLLDEFAINGSLNTARLYARLALGVLCTSLMLLWFYLPKLFERKTLNQYIMWFSGLLAFLVVFFMAGNSHDLIVRIAGAFGFIAFISCSRELLRTGYYRLGLLGLFCLLIFAVNYYIYETGINIILLPLIQKITFVSCLIWFFGLNYCLMKRLKNNVHRKNPDSIR